MTNTARAPAPTIVEELTAVEPRALEQSIVALDQWLGTSMEEAPTRSQSESMARVLHELKRLRAIEPGAAWVLALRRELMLSKMTHNFTFSRDEVIELLGGKFAVLGSMSSAQPPVA